MRPSYIHFTVFPLVGSEWKMQMYFAVDPSNKNDFLRSALGSNDARKRVTLEFRPATSAPDKDAHIGFFDIVLGMPGFTHGKA